MPFPEIPEDYLDDILKVFLLGVKQKLKDDLGNPIPDIIARSFSRSDPNYFPYIVEWNTLFKKRKRFIKNLISSEDRKLKILGYILEEIHT